MHGPGQDRGGKEWACGEEIMQLRPREEQRKMSFTLDTIINHSCVAILSSQCFPGWMGGNQMIVRDLLASASYEIRAMHDTMKCLSGNRRSDQSK